MVDEQPNTQPSDQNLGFDRVLERLRQVVAKLEQGNLSLEQSLLAFEEGVGLSRRGSEMLDAAERRVEILVRGEGGVRPQPFAPGERAMAAPKIIVVDDDRDARGLLHDVLEEAGYQVIEAQSGLRLISLLHVDRPDVILLDVMMSWIDGFELCRAIKRNPLYQDIPICFISGRDDPGDVRLGMECGAADYFVKPIDLDRLLARLGELSSSQASSVKS